MTRKRIVVIGIATFLIGTILLFPARAAYQWFVPDPVKLSGISGSIWNGKASAGVVAGVYFTNLSWSFKPLSLLSGKLAVDASVNAADGQISMTAGIGVSGSVTLNDVAARLTLATIHPALRSNRIDGVVNLQLQKLVLKNGWPAEVEGSVNVDNLVSAAAGPDPLGNFRADITTQDGAIVGLVKDAGAVLDVTGTLQLSENRSYSFTGFVAPNSETPAVLNRNLRALGSPDENGQRQFRLEGTL
jgi:general secretion pathway protein N